MFEITFENSDGEKITFPKDGMEITEFTGLGAVQANINTSVYANFDGTHFENAKVGQRACNILITFKNNAETCRETMYNFVVPKSYIKIYHSNGNRTIYVEGYVQAMECDLFAMSQIMTLSIVCPDPYFRDVETKMYYVDITEADFIFPFASTSTPALVFSTHSAGNKCDIYNSGTTDSDFIVSIEAAKSIAKVDLTIKNTYGTSTFYVGKLMSAGDKVKIKMGNTLKGITYTPKGGTEASAFDAILEGSTWLTIAPGDNTVSYVVDNYTYDFTTGTPTTGNPEDIKISFDVIEKYIGV